MENKSCDCCGNELKPVFTHEQAPDAKVTLQYEDALQINLVGGYGMYYDDLQIPIDNQRFIFCKDCADWLMEDFPAFKKVYEKEGTGGTLWKKMAVK